MSRLIRRTSYPPIGVSHGGLLAAVPRLLGVRDRRIITHFSEVNRRGPILDILMGSSNETIENLRTWLINNAFWDGGPKPLTLTLTIDAAGSVWSSNKANPSIEILAADFHPNSEITIINNGLISGRGGWSPAGGAIKATRAITVENNGTINGGGKNAAGAAGTYDFCYYTCGDSECSNDCTGGTGATGYGYSYSSAGSSATTGANGADGSCSLCTCNCPGGAGGVGSGAGNDGYCVSGNSYITWLAVGTRNGGIS